MISFKKKLILIITGLGVMVSGLSLASVAWFGGRNSVGTMNQLGGDVLKSYFHGGNGSEATPFSITTPYHYENFAKLHYKMDKFASSHYYFEFGAPLVDGDSTKYFYGTDENGVVDFNVKNATTLNLGGETFEPIGNESKPFIGSLNGNNLTITNFKVDGTGYHDIGIFGFIGEQSKGVYGTIKNCYFDNFTINTKGAIATDAHDATEGRAHTEYAHVGYIAGHIAYSDGFSNVYVNNCTIDGEPTKSRVLNNYGYFGKVEHDYSGEGPRHGNTYSFNLSSSKVFNAIDSSYNTIKENPLRVRVGTQATEDPGRQYADYSFPIAGEGEEWVNNAAKHPVSEAITKVNNQTYRINGTTTAEYKARSYSLSTVGYQPLTGGIPTEYEITNDNSLLKDLNRTITKSNNEPAIINQTKKGDFFRYDSGGQQWYYQHSENEVVTLNFASESSYTVSCDNNPTNLSSINKAYEYIYLDNVLLVAQELSGVSATSPSKNKATFSNITLPVTQLKLNLGVGKHSIAFLLAISTNANSAAHCYIKESSCSISAKSSNRRNWTVTQGTFNTTSLTQTLNFSLSDGYGYYCLDKGNQPNISWNSTSGTVGRYASPNSFDLALTGLNRTTKVSGALTDSTITTFIKEKYQEIHYDEQGKPYYVDVALWVARNAPTRSVDYNASPVYLSDNSSLTDANYKYKNIDIVGGNVDFYYLEKIWFIPVNIEVISLPAETDATNIVEYPICSQIGQQFHATQNCPGTAVMFVSNIANAADDVDSQIGHVEFKYVNVNYRGQSLLDITKPSFKKGSGHFIDLKTLGRIEEGEGIELISNFIGDITESGAKKVSYCCLDKSGNILGVYDMNGNPGYGFYRAATDKDPKDKRYSYTPGTKRQDQEEYTNGTYTKSESGTYVLDETKLRSIATYVIVLGAGSNASTNPTYITEIDFTYKAVDGSGGSFGTVGYRSATDTVASTILNFYLDASASLDYSIKVRFVKNDSTYYITFEANAVVKINVFNYDLTNYHLSFNGDSYPNETNEITYTPPSG